MLEPVRLKPWLSVVEVGSEIEERQDTRTIRIRIFLVGTGARTRGRDGVPMLNIFRPSRSYSTGNEVQEATRKALTLPRRVMPN